MGCWGAAFECGTRLKHARLRGKGEAAGLGDGVCEDGLVPEEVSRCW